MKKLPPLLYTTDEGRRVYELQGIINQRKIDKLVIDPHCEEEHRGYMTDEIIYNFAFELEKEEMWKPEKRRDGRVLFLSGLNRLASLWNELMP